jgi:hypothetical protein
MAKDPFCGPSLPSQIDGPSLRQACAVAKTTASDEPAIRTLGLNHEQGARQTTQCAPNLIQAENNRLRLTGTSNLQRQHATTRTPLQRVQAQRRLQRLSRNTDGLADFISCDHTTPTK